MTAHGHPIPVLHNDTCVTKWYTGTHSSRPRNILQAAYDRAWSMFTKEVGSCEELQSQYRQNTSIDDVLSAVMIARSKYQDMRHSKCRAALTAVSERLSCYQNMFDVLVQQHPEYVSLAWGAFKFIFTGFVNHEECITKLAKATTTIAKSLPRSHLHALLYPTLDMEMAIAELYAQVMDFLQDAICWYQRSKLAHAWLSVWQPWSLRLKAKYDIILELSQSVDSLAMSGLQAETRDIHVDVSMLRSDVSKLALANQKLSELIEARFSVVDTGFLSLNDKLDVSFGEQRGTLCRMQVNQLLSLSVWTVTATSGQCLGFCQSLDRRQRGKIVLEPPETRRLNEWARNEISIILFINSWSIASSKTLVLRIIELLREAHIPVIWALRYHNYYHSSLNTIDILRMLVFQALSINPDSQAATSNPVTAAHLREAVNDDDWIEILKRCLCGMRMIFIAFDPELLSFASNQDRHKCGKMVESLSKKLRGVAKIIVSSWNLQRTYVEQKRLEEGHEHVDTDGHLARQGHSGNTGMTRRTKHRQKNQMRKRSMKTR